MLPSDPQQRTECLNWLFFQVGAGPYIGQFGHFYKYANDKIPYAIERYATETQRLLDVLDHQLQHGKPYLLGNIYTIADIAWFPWIIAISEVYDASPIIEVSNYKYISKWLENCLAKESTKRGMLINSMNELGVRDYSSGDQIAGCL
eukprot:TRINITY_DN4029_c0_g1_i2.p1 TRINITY_DN4029_c0_g1~~TRINITY_DN4029_c0_g1_i2.p1  ORF type:complete len:147 (-),score=23.14 TRINITY_DN4029_c0_g1_i2:31-471(-)